MKAIGIDMQTYKVEYNPYTEKYDVLASCNDVYVTNFDSQKDAEEFVKDLNRAYRDQWRL